ncbi:YciI family protein [soil metagenome]
MKFICLGFYDEAKFVQTPPEETQKMMDGCMAYDDELRRGGHFIGGEALDSSRNTVFLRIRSGEVEVSDGPFAETKEILGGILLLAARDKQHAIALMSKHPALKFGNVFEIWGANEEMNRIVAERNAKVAREG